MTLYVHVTAYVLNLMCMLLIYHICVEDCIAVYCMHLQYNSVLEIKRQYCIVDTVYGKSLQGENLQL